MDEKKKEIKAEQYDRTASIIDGEPEETEAPLPLPKKSRWPVAVLAVLMGLVLVFGLLWAFDVISFAKKPQTDPSGQTGQTQPTGTAPTGSDPAGTDSGLRLLPAATQGDSTLTLGMFGYDLEHQYRYYLVNIFNNTGENFASYLYSIGLDTTLPLKEQTAYMRQDTWFDFFVTVAKEDASWMLTMSRAAKENGLTLTEEDKDMVESNLAATDFSALHNGVTEEDARAYWEMYCLAKDQEDRMFLDLAVTEAQVNAAYEKDPRQYQVCDYTYFLYSFGEDGEYATEAEAKAAAAPLIGARTEEEFEGAVADWLIGTGKMEDREEAILAYRQVCVSRDAAYREGAVYNDWLFDSATRPGDTRTFTENGAVAVFMLLTSPHRDESITVDVRHILITADEYGSDDGASAKAEEILNTWRSGEATAASFGALAKEYTADGNGDEGGLYTGVTPGQMVEEFNDWCFDPARKPGDSGIVKTRFGYHVMYFQKAGAPAWYTAVEEDLLSEAFEPIYQQLCEKYPVTFLDENIQKLDL